MQTRRALTMAGLATAVLGWASPAHAQASSVTGSAPQAASIASVPTWTVVLPGADPPAPPGDTPPKQYVYPKTDPPTAEDCTSRGGQAETSKYGKAYCNGGDLDGRGLRPGPGPG
jgi:hypothetical protein